MGGGRRCGGANSPFTSSLIKHLATPGLDINDVLRKVRADVLAATGQKQNPWSMDNLTGGFQFASAAVAGTSPPVPGSGVESMDLPPDTLDTAAKLRDESRREEEARKQWGEWRKKMKAAFDEAAAQERKDLAAETKARWFESFLTDYGQDDPTSTDDERLRADAKARADKWRGEVAASGAAQAGATGLGQPEPEQLTKSQLLAVLKKHGHAIASCKERQPEASGVVMVHVRIEKSGMVSFASVRAPFAGTPVGDCVEVIARTWEFPQFRGDAMSLTIPLAL